MIKENSIVKFKVSSGIDYTTDNLSPATEDNPSGIWRVKSIDRSLWGDIDILELETLDGCITMGGVNKQYFEEL